jgi:crotonobetainyl-CoA:carnitine CoA-transferase CaiB-like acyl-CoA transferase
MCSGNAQEETTMAGPLEGVRIIDLTGTVLGPMGTQVLGDAGADVIKVEPPAGDPVRYVGPRRSHDMGAYFVNLNRNKRSVVLDLHQPAARAALLKLIDGADVFVHNMRLAAATRAGLDYAALSARNPRLIHASATGYRMRSSLRDEPAYDDIIQGRSGIASLNGIATGSDGPRYVPTVMADKITGHVLAGAIGMALYHRERSGRGQALHVPMLDTVLAFLLPEHLWGHSINEPDQGIGYTRMLTPHRRPYATADGFLCIIAVTDEQWRRLFRLFGREALIDDPRFCSITARAANIDTVYGIVTEEMVKRTTAQWYVLLKDADLPHGAANTLEDLRDDPYLREVEFFQAMNHPTEGAMTTLAIPVDYFGTPAEIRRPPPRLGEHSGEVLREIGLSEAEIIAVSGAKAA